MTPCNPNIKAYLSSLSGLLVLSACAAQPTPTSHLETLHSVTTHSAHLQILVSNHGCTRPEHFELKAVGSMMQDGAHQHDIEVHRTQPDGCRKRTEAKSIRISYEGLGIVETDTVRVLNPVKPFKKNRSTK